MSSKPAPARSLSMVLAERLRSAMLPGDAPFSEDGLEQAAAFTTVAASTRQPAGAAIAIESVSGPAGERFMRLALINDDMPFLVDSIASTIAAHGLAIDRLIHPVIPVRRDEQGRLIEIVVGEAAGELGRVDPLPEQLHRHEPVGRGLAGLVDPTHAPLRDQAENRRSTDLFTRTAGRRGRR